MSSLLFWKLLSYHSNKAQIQCRDYSSLKIQIKSFSFFDKFDIIVSLKFDYHVRKKCQKYFQGLINFSLSL
jgi:hypothetical protein